MALSEPKIKPEQLGTITAPALVLAADRDLMTLDHTVALFQAIPAAKLAIIPGASHGLLFEKAALVNQIILDFLAS